MGFFLILRLVSYGYVRTYADEYYGRIRGSNQSSAIDGGIIFLILFGCLVGSFFLVCILGTIILGIFDRTFHCSIQLFSR